MNNLFDLFGIDFDNLSKRFADVQEAINDKYNDVVKNIKKYDLNTQDGYESFIKDSAELRKELEANDGVFSKYMINLLDKAVKEVMQKHNDKKTLAEEIVNQEVERNRKMNNSKVNTPCEYHTKNVETESEADEKFVRPSDNLTYKQAKNIWNFVDEYMETMVEPYLSEDYDEDTIDDMANGLFEFAAWLLNR